MQQPLENESSVLVFTLSGLNETTEHRYVLLSFTVLYYSLVAFCNLTLIITILLHKKLHEPMYLFLCNLCVNGLCGTSGFYPKFLYDLLAYDHVISYVGCMIQIVVIYSSVGCEFSTLTVMAYDRYVAICRPLEYHSIMTSWMIVKCILFCWLTIFFLMAVLIVLLARLNLCGSTIDKLYCEVWAVAKLSCVSVTINNVFGYIVMVIYFGQAVLVVCSYFYLIKNCIKSIEGRHKFIQTCVPHLLSVINFTVALLFDLLYSRYGSKSLPQGVRNFMALEFLVVPPILNPLIYGLNLTAVRQEVIRLFFKKPVRVS